MAYVYQNIIIGDCLDIKNGCIMTTTKGDMLTHNGTIPDRLPVGTDGQAIIADSTQATGLLWKNLTPADVGLIAGDGLTLTGSTIDAVGSSTIIANANNLEVNSSDTANQVLLSTGTPGTAAVYGAVPLASGSITGVLPIANGGTNVSSFSTGSRLISTNAGNTALETTTLDPAVIVTLTDAQTLTNKTLTTPIITTSINDSNGNQVIDIISVASAVNELSITNAVAGTAPSLSAAGDDTDIDLNLNPKGTGTVNISGIAYPNIDGADGQVIATNGAGSLFFANVPIISVATASTTDATPTTIGSATISTVSDTAYFVEAKFLAKNTTTFDVASFIARATFKNVAGTLTRIGLDLIYTPPTTSWVVDVLVSGTDIIFQVTGTDATNVSWKVEVDSIVI